MKNSKKTPFGDLSIIFAILSLFFLPPLIMLIGIILSIIGIAKEEGGKAIAGFLLNLVLGTIGMIISAIFWLTFLN